MQIQPYLYFDGRCEEAIQFYQSVLGAEVQLMMRHKENPEPPPQSYVPAGSDDKVMHATLKIGDTMVMVSDGYCNGRPLFQGFSLSVSLPSTQAASTVFAALSGGGEVKMPLTRTFWSPCFGMVADRFGVSWMVTVAV